MIVVLSPIVTITEMEGLVDHISSRNMTLAYSKSHMHVFLPTHEAKVTHIFISGDAPVANKEPTSEIGAKKE